MPDRERFECLRCERTFLSREALERHYDRNPEHAEAFVLDADAIDASGTVLPDSEWVETDETVETFVTVREGDPENIEMTYDPRNGSLVVEGVRDRELDLSSFWDEVGERLTWSFDGTYHKLQFHKEDDG